jgi:hypothetical protein
MEFRKFFEQRFNLEIFERMHIKNSFRAHNGFRLSVFGKINAIPFVYGKGFKMFCIESEEEKWLSNICNVAEVEITTI